MRLLLFRRANKVLEISNGDYKIIDLYEDENDEIINLTSFEDDDRIGSTNGFYTVGVKGDILMFYINNDIPIVKYKDLVFNLLDDLKINCYQINKKEWVFKCFDLNNHNGFEFVYEPYVYFPFEDDCESDVNFGLWLIELVKNEELLNRVIKHNR